ncbi:MAG: 1-hydroxycarotenoid 3,4-desaturase CrtD [Myxococcota bacterium]
MPEQEIVVVGAGIGGLSTALELAALGYGVTVVEKAHAVGGKMRTVEVDGRAIDSGPTVLTMREVFDGLFERAGVRFDQMVQLRPLRVLARHGWSDQTRLDLFADPERSAEAIGEVFGKRDADGYRRFCAHTAKIHDAVRGPFMEGSVPGLLAMARQLSFSQMRKMAAVDWHRSMWKSLRKFFRSPKLHQLFGRYATYYGSSPFEAPATLNVIAHVEKQGVWAIDGGMIQLARAMASRLQELGGQIRLGTTVSEVLVQDDHAAGVRLADGQTLSARAVVLNTTPEAVVAGLLGQAPREAVQPSPSPHSLSAITWSMVGQVRDFPLAYHNVLFSDDYPAEFDQLRAGRVPEQPTVYLCAQDRDPGSTTASLDPAPQRLFCLVNAPARGDDESFDPEIDRCKERCFEQMSRCGLTVEATPSRTICTTPRDFAQMFPGSGGALYGPATNNFMATFSRPGARTKLKALYLVGGGAHPGAGIPMVTLGGRLAARSAHADLTSTPSSHRVATFGGMSTASATTAVTP